MIPGVECARRRRVHSIGRKLESSSAEVSGRRCTRRPIYCLYAGSHISFSASRADTDEKLWGATRIAKGRLDEQLRRQQKLDIRRKTQKPSNVSVTNRKRERPSVEDRQCRIDHWKLPTEVFGTKKTRGRLTNWFSCRVRESEDCYICQNRFKSGETLMHLPCAHKFHSKCLVTWLDNHVHCPYCRKEIRN